MGLLDDAIREHLELKRQRGADPTEVAQQERAALAPIGHDELEPVGADFDSEDAPDHSGDLDDGEADDSVGPEGSNDLQETAEIDMRTVLEDLDAEEESSRLGADGRA
jgi:hypothetical protein